MVGIALHKFGLHVCFVFTKPCRFSFFHFLLSTASFHCAVCDLQLTNGEDMAPVGYHRVTTDAGNPANISGHESSQAFLWYFMSTEKPSAGTPPPITG